MPGLQRARRILIVPEGPLRNLPFAALALPGEPLRFVGTWKPLFTSPSVGAFLALKSRRQLEVGDGGMRTALIAFADPDYSGTSPVIRRTGLTPLPGSRSEALRIAAGFQGAARVYLGQEVTERCVLGVEGPVRYLHFALHARPDPRFPLQSALYLSIPATDQSPADDDGVLHAWEIMDGLHLNGEVITLSGCSTGRGEPVRGEGILGLARAFQYAGARSVVASQWSVADRPTEELMARFYAGLTKGLSTAEALQRAEQTLAVAPLRLRDGTTLDARHPFYWAAFQVIGDWR